MCLSHAIVHAPENFAASSWDVVDFSHFKNLLHLRLWNFVLSHVNLVTWVPGEKCTLFEVLLPRIYPWLKGKRKGSCLSWCWKAEKLYRQDYPECLLKTDCVVCIWLWYTRNSEMDSVWNCSLCISGQMVRGRWCWGVFLFLFFWRARDS